jgi:hypothetical protein
MERWVSALSDGSLTGFARWYVQLHLAGCRRCQAALEALRRLQESLHALRTTESAPPTTLSPPRRQALEAALDEVEKRRR